MLVFQFHKGAIRTAVQVSRQGLQVYFNSIKVRLERCFQLIYSPRSEFQFHKGAIRTDDANVPAVRVPNFNSIKVRLEHTLFSNLLSVQHFNSIKVRLELIVQHNLLINSRFQFHKGAIRTVLTYMYN